MRGSSERTFIGESCNLLRNYCVFLYAGARPAHTFQRRLGDHLSNTDLTRKRVVETARYRYNLFLCVLSYLQLSEKNISFEFSKSLVKCKSRGCILNLYLNAEYIFLIFRLNNVIRDIRIRKTGLEIRRAYNISND